MLERKIPLWVKTAAVAVLSIAVLGAVFIGANRMVFAGTTERTTQLPPFEAMSAAANGAGSEAATPNRRNLTVQERSFDAWPWGHSHEPGENTLNADEAAQMGAQYIHDIFGVCVDGTTVEMTYYGQFSHRNTFGVWMGTVKTNDGAILYFFMINAETGEAIHVEDMADHEGGVIIPMPRSNLPIIVGPPFSPHERRHGFDLDLDWELEWYTFRGRPDHWSAEEWREILPRLVEDEAEMQERMRERLQEILEMLDEMRESLSRDLERRSETDRAPVFRISITV